MLTKKGRRKAASTVVFFLLIIMPVPILIGDSSLVSMYVPTYQVGNYSNYLTYPGRQVGRYLYLGRQVVVICLRQPPNCHVLPHHQVSSQRPLAFP